MKTGTPKYLNKDLSKTLKNWLILTIGTLNYIIALNFYLNKIWKNDISPEEVASAFVEGNTNILGFPFTAPDNITKKPAYFIFSFTKKDKHGYLNMTKMSAIGDSVFSIIYSKKMDGRTSLEDYINTFLLKDLNSGFGSATVLGNIGIDESWISYLETLAVNKG